MSESIKSISTLTSLNPWFVGFLIFILFKIDWLSWKCIVLNAWLNEIVLIWNILVLPASWLIIKEIINLFFVFWAILANVVHITFFSCDVNMVCNVLLASHHSSNILRLLLLVLVWTTLSITGCGSPCVLLIVSVTSILATTVHHIGILSWNILLALVKLIADSSILHACTHKLLESVIMTINFECICNDILNSIVMTNNLNFVNHPELSLTTARYFRKHLVVVPSDQQICDCISRSNLNLAVVASEHNSITWFH